MVRFDEQEISALRARADIAEVISHYLPVKRKGRSYVALCPFHDDHSPSMSISTDKQIYKCFVCGAGGNVFTFVQNYEKVTFPEAVERVAEITGFELSVKAEAESVPKDPHRETLYRIMNETIRYTMYQVSTDAAVNEKEYLEKRGLDEAVRQKFQIGYNPAGDSLYRFLHAKGYEDRDMSACNVVRITESGASDVFAGRITFPIHDEHGNPVAFSARTIDPRNPSKYINTNDTELFQKGDIVYNWHRARASARKEGKVYVCEGVTDVIAFSRAGMDNAVCTLGTSCTKNQISLLKRIAARIIFCYDGDSAGQSATWRAAKMARESGCEVTVIDNQTGLDPDEMIRQNGPEGLKSLVRNEISWMEFVLKYLQKQTNLNNYLEKKEFVRKVQQEIAALDDEFDRRHFTDELSRIAGMRVDYVPAPRRQTYTSETLQKASAPDGTKKAEDMILGMMMNSPEACRIFEEKLGFLPDALKNTLAMTLVDKAHNGVIDIAGLIDSAENREMNELITSIGAESGSYPYDPAILNGAIRKILISVKSTQAEAFREQLRQQTLNPESLAVISREYQECIRDLRRYYEEEDSENDE